ncbi:MAG: iron ABC transporter permease [Alphaproteobacteria bacterium]|nr:iron ABC transporter permease [Alphaproteobacteria bacterium]
MSAASLGRGLRLDASGAVLAALGLLLVALVGLPMFWLGLNALDDRAGGLTLGNFAAVLGDASFREPLWTTLILASTVSLASCAVAAPLGWLVARTDMPLARPIRSLITASFVTPPFLGAVAWEILAAPNSGLLNALWRAATGAPEDMHLFNVYSLHGLCFVISCFTFPFTFVLVANALDRIPAELEDASSILGGGVFATLRRVTIPLVLPALLAGAVVAFLQAMTLFGSPAILALPAGFHTLTTKIWSLFQFPPKPHLAAAAAVPLLLVTILLLRLQRWIIGRRSYAVIGGKHGQPRLMRLGPWRWLALAVALAVLSLPVFLPYAALLKAALTRIPSAPVTFEALTLKHFNFVFVEFSQTRSALKNTVILGVAAATIGTGIAMVLGYLAARQAVRGHRWIDFLATAPVAIPGIVLGVGLFLAYTRPPFMLYGTLWILLFAYLTIELPIAFQQIRSALHGIHPELEEAGRILGASRLRMLKDVTAPLLTSGLVAAWCFIFIGVTRELSAAIMLFTANTKVISVVIYDLNESGDLGPIAVLGLLLLAISFVVVALASRFRTQGPGRVVG